MTHLPRTETTAQFRKVDGRLRPLNEVAQTICWLAGEVMLSQERVIHVQNLGIQVEVKP